jgi:hypothetical protein
MAVLDKKVQAGLDAAREQGFKVRPCAAGTLVINPHTGASTTVNVKEGRKHTRQNAIHSLHNIDVVLPEGIRPQQKKAHRPDTPKRSEQPNPAPQESEDTPMRTGTPTPSFLEQRYGIAVDKVIDDPTSPELLLVDVRDKADGEQCVYRNRNGLKWVGNLWEDVVRKLWDDLPESAAHDQALRLHQHVIANLREANKLLAMPTPTLNPTHVAWWVCLEEESVTAAPARPPTRAVVATNSDDKAKPSVQLFHCPKCPFADPSRHALVMHTNRTGDEEHPVEQDGPFPCPEDGCRSVRTSRASYKMHMKRAHGANGPMCDECLDFWPDRVSLNRHRSIEHPRAAIASPRRSARAIEPPAASAITEPTPIRATDPVSAPPPSSPQDEGSLDEVDRMIEMLTDYRKLKAADREKDQMIAQLSLENEKLKARLDKIQSVFGD